MRAETEEEDNVVRIPTEIMDSPAFRALNTDAVRLWLECLRRADHVDIGGMTLATAAQLAAELSWRPQRAEAALGGLVAAGFIRVAPSGEIIVADGQRFVARADRSRDRMRRLRAAAKASIAGTPSGDDVTRHCDASHENVTRHIDANALTDNECCDAALEDVTRHISTPPVPPSAPSPLSPLETPSLRSPCLPPNPPETRAREIAVSAPPETPAPMLRLDGGEQPPSLATIPLHDGSGFEVTPDQAAIWERAYPGVNVRTELAKVIAYLDALGTRRRCPTRTGVKRMVNDWMRRAADFAVTRGARDRSHLRVVERPTGTMATIHALLGRDPDGGAT